MGNADYTCNTVGLLLLFVVVVNVVVVSVVVVVVVVIVVVIFAPEHRPLAHSHRLFH